MLKLILKGTIFVTINFIFYSNAFSYEVNPCEKADYKVNQFFLQTSARYQGNCMVSLVDKSSLDEANHRMYWRSDGLFQIHYMFDPTKHNLWGNKSYYFLPKSQRLKVEVEGSVIKVTTTNGVKMVFDTELGRFSSIGDAELTYDIGYKYLSRSGDIDIYKKDPQWLTIRNPNFAFFEMEYTKSPYLDKESTGSAIDYNLGRLALHFGRTSCGGLHLNLFSYADREKPQIKVNNEYDLFDFVQNHCPEVIPIEDFAYTLTYTD